MRPFRAAAELDHEGLTTTPHFPRNVLCVIKRVRCETAREAEVAQLEVEVRMPAPSSFDENTTRRPICRAVQMLRSMSCPFVLGYIDSWMHRDSLCIVTEYCPGGDLYQRLKKEKVDLSEDTVLDYFLQTTQALAHLHERAVMHRDVKVRALSFAFARAAASARGAARWLSPFLTSALSRRTSSSPTTGGCV